MTDDLSATRHDRPPPLSRVDGAWFLFPLTAWLVRILSKQIRQGETGERGARSPHPFLSRRRPFAVRFLARSPEPICRVARGHLTRRGSPRYVPNDQRFPSMSSTANSREP